jgi:hypothetical protein
MVLTVFAAAAAAAAAAAVIITQPLDASVDLKAFCAVGQPDHDERGDLVVRYRDDKVWKDLAAKLHPMQPDLKVGGWSWWVSFTCAHLFWRRAD